MLKLLRNTTLLAATVILGTAAQAGVLTFEDRASTSEFLSATYQGFNFGNTNSPTTTWFSSAFTDAPYAPPSSGTHFISTDSSRYGPGAPAAPAQASEAITAAGTLFSAFIFDGASFNGYSTDSIHYELYSLGSLVYTSADVGIGPTPTFVASGYSGMVDAVRVFGFQGYYGLDDFTYRLAADLHDGNDVPEPGSFALVLAALAAAGIVRRKRAR